MLVGEFAVFMGRRGVILGFLVLTDFVVMRGLMVVVRGSMVVSGGFMMVLVRRMLR